jgi:hypothetical protein
MEHADEKRRALRFPCVLQTTFVVLELLDSSHWETVSTVGFCQNICKGGVGVLSNRLITGNAVLRAEFSIDGCPIAVPTLMKVRWLRPVMLEGRLQHKMGLQFLI